MADNRLQLGITITADGKAAEQALDRVKGKLGQVSRSTTDMAAAANLARSAFSAMAAALSTRELLRTADAYASMQARLKLVSGTSQEFLTAQTELFRISQQNLAPLGETIALYTKLSTSIRDMGKSQADALQVTDLVAKTLRISGASAQESAAALLQFGQALGSGVLQGDELRAILESSPRLARALAEGLGVATGQLKAMGAAGELSSKKVVEALQSQAATIKSEYTTMPVTVSGAWQQMENAATKYIGQTDQAAGSSRKLAEALSLVANNLESIADPLATVVGTITKIEVSGWLQFRDILGSIKTNLKEMVGLKDAGSVDPEVQRLVKLGQGQVPIDELAAGQQAQTQYFDGVKRGATDAALAMTKLSDKQKEVAALVIDTANAHKVDPAWALAIAQQESGFNQLAKSAAGAQGVMQLMPGTAKQLGVNIADVNDNIKGGVLYLKQQQEQFKSLKLASAAYNAGPGNVQKYGGVPPFKETQNYVQSVAALYQKWQQVLGAQGTAFVSAKDQADELKTAYESLKTHQDGMVSAAENFAKVQVEKIKTSLTALESERKATQDVATAQLASAKTYDDKQRILADIAQQQDAYAQRAAALAQQELSAQQSVIEARRNALTTELANADRYNLTIIEQAKLKQEIASADADLAVLAQQRAQAEIDAGQAVSEAARQSADLRQAEQNAISDVIAQYGREVEVLNRLTQAKQAGASADQLGFLNQYYSQAGQLPEVVSAEQLQRMQQYQLSTLAVKDAIQAMIKPMQDQAKAEQAVADEQLRLNAAFQNGVQQAQLFAKHAAEAFGQAGEGIGKMAIGIAQFFEQSWQASRDLQTELKKAEQIGPEDSADRMKAQFDAISKAAAKSAQYQIGLFGDITDAAQGYFNESSKGYAALHNATKVFRAFEMAMAVQSMVTQIAGNTQILTSDTARTGVEIMNSAARGQAKAVEAVANQGSGGDPYSAFPRMAAMAAIMAAIGFAVAGAVSGGGSSTSSREQLQKTQGTGSVLGDSSAQSESIANALDVVAENTSNDLNYSAKMLAALENIESALSGAAASIFQNVAPAIANAISRIGLGRNNLDPLGLDYTSKSITDAGLYIPMQKLSDAIKGMSVAMYAQVTSAHKLFGMTISSSSKDYGAPADSQTATQFTKTIRGMRDALIEGGKEFGLSADDFNRRMKKFTIDIGKLSLMELSGEEAQKAISAVFGKIFDDMAAQLLPSIKKFQNVGEGAAEAYFRVASGLAEAKGELAQFGLSIINFKEITDKHALDIGGQAFKDSYAAQSDLNQATLDWLKTLKGGAQDVADSVRVYENAMRAMRTANLDTAGFDPLAAGNRVGGLSNLLDAIQAYNDEFLTDAQRIAGATIDLSESFLNLGFALPASKDAFVELVNSIDITKTGGNELRAALLLLAEGFGKVQNKIQDIKDKYADILNPFGKIGAQLTSVGNDFGTLINDAASKSQSAIDAFRKTRDDQVDAFTKQLSDTADMRDTLTVARNKAIADRDAAQKIIDEEMAKAPKKRNAKALNQAISDFNKADEAVRALTGFIESSNKEIAGFMAAIDKVNAEFSAASGEEQAKLAIERGKILSDAQKVMFSTVSDIIEGLAQTIQEAQQRLDNVLSFQRSLESQIAQLQGSQAVAGLANARYSQANAAVNDYIGAVSSGSRTRDTEEELRLLGDLQTAVMDRYNAEMTLINETIQQQTDALNAALQVEIDNINTSTQAQVDAVNAALDAQIAAIQAANDAQISAQQKADAATIKAIQKQNDAAIKAQQKIYDAQIKAQQKANDVVIKAQQKADDAAITALQKQQDIAVQALQNQLDAANKLKDAIASIRDYAKGLLLGAQSVASPEQKLAEAQRQYQELLAKAQGGDADAIAKISQSSDAYLQAAKDYYGSNTQYQDIFNGVQTAMTGLGAMDAPNPDSIQSHIDQLKDEQAAAIDALREAQSDRLDAIREAQSDQLDLMREQQADALDALRETQSEQLDAIREQQSAQIDAMRKAAADQIDAARKAAQDQIDAIQKDGQAQIKAAQERTAQAIKDLSDPDKNTAMKALKEATLAELKRIQELSEKTRQEAARQAEQARQDAANQAKEAIELANKQLQKLDSGLTLSRSQIQALNGLMAGLKIAYQEPVPAFAGGGSYPGGLALVGERGPEVIDFQRPAQITSNERIREAVASGDEKTRKILQGIQADTKAAVTLQSSAFKEMIAELKQLRARVEYLERDQKIQRSVPKKATA